MAQQTEKLVLDLDVNAAKYEEKLLKARKGLAKLKVESLKSKGANEKLEHSIKMATKQLKIANLERQQANASLKLHQVQLAKTTTATLKLGKSQKRSNMAMTQAAYAIDDMQYGFQGVQNNIQAMAVSMGAGGPLVIGLTAVTVAVGLFVKKLEKQNKAAKEAKKVLKDADGTIAAMMLYASVANDATASTETQKEALDKLVTNGYDPLVDSIDEYIAKLREQAKIESEVAKHQSKVQDLLEKEREAQEDLNEARNPSKMQGHLDELNALISNPKFTEDAISDEEYILNLQKQRVKEEQAKYDLAKKTTEEYLKQNKINTTGGLDTTKKKGKGDDAPKILSAEEMELQHELDEALDMLEYAENSNVDAIGKLLGQQFAKTMAGEIKTALDNDAVDELISSDFVEDAKKKMNEIDEHTKVFRDSVSGAFVSLGSTIATNLGGNGDAMSAFLGAAIGTYTKLLATNKAFLAALIPMKATEAGVNAVTSATETASKIPFGAFVLPALIAGGLAAVSSAFSSAGASGGGMSGGGGGGSKPSAVAAPKPSNPVRENARVRNSNLIIPMDMMRYGMQNAEDNYSGFN
jgi:hypothetical protein